MIITCPACHTWFQLAPASLGAAAATCAARAAASAGSSRRSRLRRRPHGWPDPVERQRRLGGGSHGRRLAPWLAGVLLRPLAAAIPGATGSRSPAGTGAGLSASGPVPRVAVRDRVPRPQFRAPLPGPAGAGGDGRDRQYHAQRRGRAADPVAAPGRRSPGARPWVVRPARAALGPGGAPVRGEPRRAATGSQRLLGVVRRERWRGDGGVEPMAVALSEAEAAAAAGEVPLGAELVASDGTLLARDRNRIEERHDPTAHAELLVIRAAAARLGTPRLVGCDLYVTWSPARCARPRQPSSAAPCLLRRRRSQGRRRRPWAPDLREPRLPSSPRGLWRHRRQPLGRLLRAFSKRGVGRQPIVPAARSPGRARASSRSSSSSSTSSVCWPSVGGL